DRTDGGAAVGRPVGERALFRQRVGANHPSSARAADPPDPLLGRRAPARSRAARPRRDRDARRELGLPRRLATVTRAGHDRYQEGRVLECRARGAGKWPERRGSRRAHRIFEAALVGWAISAFTRVCDALWRPSWAACPRTRVRTAPESRV